MRLKILMTLSLLYCKTFDTRSVPPHLRPKAPPKKIYELNIVSDPETKKITFQDGEALKINFEGAQVEMLEDMNIQLVHSSIIGSLEESKFSPQQASTMTDLLMEVDHFMVTPLDGNGMTSRLFGEHFTHKLTVVYGFKGKIHRKNFTVYYYDLPKGENTRDQ